MLSGDAWERLSVHALRAGVDKSELVERLITDHCRRFVVQDRGGPRGAGESAGPAGGPVETLAVGRTLPGQIARAEGTEGGAGGETARDDVTRAGRRAVQAGR